MDDDNVRAPCLSLFVGNLNPDYSKELLSYKLKDLLAAIDIVLQRRNIEVFKKHKRAHAFIRLKTEDEVQNVLKHLQDPAILEQSEMKGLVVKGKTLKVAKDIRDFPEYTFDKKWTVEIKKLQDTIDTLVKEEHRLQEELRQQQQCIHELQQLQQELQAMHSDRVGLPNLCCVI